MFFPQFFETLEIRSEKATLTLTLIGQGVTPSIICSVEGDVLNMGYVVAKETATATFKVTPSRPASEGCNFQDWTAFLVLLQSVTKSILLGFSYLIHIPHLCGELA